MSAQEIMAELESLGTESIRKVYRNHGVKDPYFGVKIEDLKKIQKRVKKDYALALELYATGNSDAMYLAGLIADDAKMTKKDLNQWVKAAYWAWLSEYAVPWVASESAHGRELALTWMDSKKENIASAGWSTYSSLVSIKDDAELDLDEITSLLERVEKTIDEQPNRVRYCMNGFVIAVGAYVKPLTKLASKTAKAIGKVDVDMNGTACKVPDAIEQIKKMHARGTLGRKRKSARC
jgi:3-methyladenine DNA glycosylase AlkD